MPLPVKTIEVFKNYKDGTSINSSTSKPTLVSDLPFISLFIVSVIVINWIGGEKGTFAFLLLILFGMIFTRKKEIENLLFKDLREIF